MRRCWLKPGLRIGVQKVSDQIPTTDEQVLVALDKLLAEEREANRVWRVINHRLRAALEQIAEMSPKSGGVGQIARDALRVNP
jgi:hypothetical protein